MSRRKIKLQALTAACEEYRKSFEQCKRLHLNVDENADLPTRSSMQRDALARYVLAQEHHQTALEEYEATGARAGMAYLPNRTIGGLFLPPGKGVHPWEMVTVLFISVAFLGVALLVF